MKEKASGGLGSQVKQAQVISYSDEDFLWNNSYLGMGNPEQLVRTVLFMVGLHCTLRAGAEHRSLHSIGHQSQFQYIFPNSGPRHIIYTEDLGTKTNKGGLMHKKIKPKQVTIFSNEQNHNHCPVCVFYCYNSLLPLKCKCDALYLYSLWWWGLVSGCTYWSEQVEKLCERDHETS